MLDTFQALAEPNRLAIVSLLKAGPRSVGDVVDALGIRQPQVSKHLSTLKAAGLVEVHPEANRRIYRLRAQPFMSLQAWLEDYRALWAARFDEMDKILEEIQQPGDEPEE